MLCVFLGYLVLVRQCTAVADFALNVTSVESLAEYEGCKDYKSDCELWQSLGECDANPAFMYYQCAKSCHVGCVKCNHHKGFEEAEISYPNNSLCEDIGDRLKRLETRHKPIFIQLLAFDDFIDTLFGFVVDKFKNKTNCDLNDDEIDCYGFSDSTVDDPIDFLKRYINDALFTISAYNSLPKNYTQAVEVLDEKLGDYFVDIELLFSILPEYIENDDLSGFILDNWDPMCFSDSTNNYEVAYVALRDCQFNDVADCIGSECVLMTNDYVQICGVPMELEAVNNTEMENEILSNIFIDVNTLCLYSNGGTILYDALCDYYNGTCNDNGICIPPIYDDYMNISMIDYNSTNETWGFIDAETYAENDPFFIAPQPSMQNIIRRLFGVPTRYPTTDPTQSPSTDPTQSPSTDPTGSPSTDPTLSPSTDPTQSPTTDPTASPTAISVCSVHTKHCEACYIMEINIQSRTLLQTKGQKKQWAASARIWGIDGYSSTDKKVDDASHVSEFIADFIELGRNSVGKDYRGYYKPQIRNGKRLRPGNIEKEVYQEMCDYVKEVMKTIPLEDRKDKQKLQKSLDACLNIGMVACGSGGWIAIQVAQRLVDQRCQDIFQTQADKKDFVIPSGVLIRIKFLGLYDPVGIVGYPFDAMHLSDQAVSDIPKNVAGPPGEHQKVRTARIFSTDLVKKFGDKPKMVQRKVDGQQYMRIIGNKRDKLRGCIDKRSKEIWDNVNGIRMALTPQGVCGHPQDGLFLAIELHGDVTMKKLKNAGKLDELKKYMKTVNDAVLLKKVNGYMNKLAAADIRNSKRADKYIRRKGREKWKNVLGGLKDRK